jgi:hypothetical protein
VLAAEPRSCCCILVGSMLYSYANFPACLAHSLTASAWHSRPAQLRTVSSVQSQHPGTATAMAAADTAPDPLAALKQSAAAAAPPPPAETVEMRLPLPAADFAEPVLSVTTDFPPSATAGQPFRCG